MYMYVCVCVYVYFSVAHFPMPASTSPTIKFNIISAWHHVRWRICALKCNKPTMPA